MNRLVAILGSATLLSLAPSARAEPTFPMAVDTFIMVPGGVEKIYTDAVSPGCHLCHVNPAGGGPPFTAFGNALHISASGTASVNTLNAALSTLNQTYPRAIEDLQMSIDPNSDPSALSGSVAVQYGCGSIAGAGDPRSSSAPWSASVVAALAFWRRSGKGRRSRIARGRNSA
jgi:hypothetical protein